MVQSRFIKFYAKTRDFEGVPSDHAWDPGAETMYGLSARYNPALAYKIRNGLLTIEEATEYAYQKYFVRKGFDEVKNDSIAFVLFDSYFSGQGIAVGKSIQKTYNLYSSLLKVPPLRVDGIIGPRSIKAINKLPFGGSFLLPVVEAGHKVIAKRLAKSTVKRQIAEGLEVKNIENGYKNRLDKRIRFAYEVANV